MAGQAAEQIIAGVVLSERLAVTMYGAIHRAQFGGQRNLRGLVVDPKMLEEDAFRISLTDSRNVAAITKLEHVNIVPTMTVESGGPDVVIVTRGVGRYVTVQDLITAARARSKQGGKLSMPVAGLIGKSVIEALAAAHKAGLIHGAVHPRSVLIDEDGAVRLGDFIAGRALTTAVAQGADSTLWRGLAGYIAPELVVGEDPTPGVDVFAVGALLFAMLTGEVPPGSLRATPAIERLVQRALDTDASRRYKTANDMLENLLEALEDDRWDLADRGELIKEAGLTGTDENIDDATEDLLASLGKGTMPITSRPSSTDLRAEANKRKASTEEGLDSLITGLSGTTEDTSLTHVDDVMPKRRDPISDIIRHDPRKREAIVSSARVPSLDDPDDPDDDDGLTNGRSVGRAKSETLGDGPAAVRRRSDVIKAARAPSDDEAAALAAIGDLDTGAKRMSSAAEQASAAAVRMEEAAERVERASKRADSDSPAPRPRRVAKPIVDDIDDDIPAPRIKSRIPGIIALLVMIGAGVGFYYVYKDQQDKNKLAEERRAKEAADKEALEKKLRDELPDPGAIKITSNPAQAGVWLKLGRTPVDSLPLSSAQLHEIRLEGVDGFTPVDTQVMPVHWSGEGEKRTGALTVPLKPVDKKLKEPVKLPAMPPKPPEAFGFVQGRGPLHIESTPKNAEVWLYVGMTNQMSLDNIQAGAAYELRVLKDGYKPAFVTVAVEEWREDPNDKKPINIAKKKTIVEKAVELEEDPDAVKKEK